jgi:hypothetical protein
VGVVSVTTDLETTVGTLTRVEAKILAHFTAGDTVAAAAQAAGVPDHEALRVIQQVARNNRSYARTLTLAWQQANPAAAMAKAAAPAPGPPAGDAVHVGDGDRPDGVIGRAVASGVPKLVRLADRVSELLDQLEQQVREYEQSKELRAKAEELERQLAEVRRQLAPKRATPVLAGAVDGDRPDPATVRAWAADAGVECPARGRLPDRVVAAYRQAVAGV